MLRTFNLIQMSLKTYGYDAEFHMFGDIIPNEIIGGAEMADDMRVARKLPEDTAAEIRKAISYWI